MKIISSLLITLFSAVVLIVDGAPANKTSPVLAVTCPNGGVCAAGIELDFTGLDPSTTYTFTGVNTSYPDTCCGSIITPAPDGTYSLCSEFLSAGTWEFVLTPEHKNGKPAHSPDIDQTFDNY
jgi:hypothetical protein